MIYQKFKRFVEAHRLFSPESRLLVAVSGGQDSVALVHLLLELKRDWPGLDVALAHFNHQLRASAAADERFVRQLAKKLLLKLFVGRGRVREFARQNRLNLEEAGRLKRYEFLEKAAEKWGAELVLTAHTMTDQAETVLMRIFRGTGVEGLQAIRLRAGQVARPLLGLKREELEQYLREKGLKFRVDETNLDTSILRNRIRLELIPQLEKEFDPEVVSHLAQLALIAQDENEALDELTEGMWAVVTRGCCGRHKHKEESDRHAPTSPGLELDLRNLREMPVAIARRLVRKFLHLALGLESPSFEQTQAILALGEGQKFSWGKDKVLINEGGWIKKFEKKSIALKSSIKWSGKESLLFADRWEFKAEILEAKKAGKLKYDDASRCYLDAEKLELPFEVRSRRPGDKYRPLGLKGEKKLKDLLREKKIPQAERDILPVFLSGGRIAWVPGLPVADEFKVTPYTRKIFVIEKSDLPG
ncbi:MAG: tRNA lysidine(34) synthetase TilS [Candidatus Saccharicenans sp.]|jgi:tRNA(Ile)-lysidine synthase|nr:tRNA lysidine(34) synthetase TilS [Candidatus Saccharicenans sp.]MDH7574607.1 tRNA lysidine(34) synthetase TilS [Candidatus Saccharicenans sp.]